MPAASVQLNGFVGSQVSSSATERSGFFARILSAVQEAQTRRAEREIARYIEMRGGRMTDDLERRIERHFV
ncbi:hypothetical protein [Enterovirga rhinocerotis]|uniref:Uncharacterized protein n=1 Tax=Enterovirga rhinocerotis TaxID=1339210 RepID=A0A4R7C7U9_9HYPH|nr:hypothetical protein [Enterovirga rhinocerotis]TDR94704.1 hypothetical protein EV668_1992 [Enterovirga rhinocerotis]